ncbi:ferredoxin [Streptomyces boluensis]|uniref:Ferredoxin n=1 Tax=Streptomyces boluensis TaxID=1775135 RepID=A0A964XJT3_9ACTN|nr:ferredoxin [Streptomyces boluensis]NBE50017.1 ferredoxin [Streptomyces boluensis]
MALQITVDLEGCKGYACCMMEAPELFDIDDETGKAILLEERPSADRAEEAERAARSCPASVILVRNG